VAILLDKRGYTERGELIIVSPALHHQGVTRTPAELRRLVYFLSAVLVQVGIFSTRWNVVIGGQVFSKSLRGLTVYKVQMTGLEGFFMSAFLLVLPLVILWLLVRLLPPWPEAEAKASSEMSALSVPASPAG